MCYSDHNEDIRTKGNCDYCLAVSRTPTNYRTLRNRTTDMSDDTYNGWTNRETWAFALHLNNDQGLQTWAHETVRQSIAEWDISWPGDPVPDSHIGRLLIDAFEEAFDSGAYYAMLRDIGSFWRINATEIGEAFKADVLEGQEQQDA